MVKSYKVKRSKRKNYNKKQTRNKRNRSIRRKKRGGAMPVGPDNCKNKGIICTTNQKCIENLAPVTPGAVKTMGSNGDTDYWKYECVGSERPEYHY